MSRKDFTEMADAVKSTMKKIVPSMVDKRVNKIANNLVPLYVAEGLFLDREKTQTHMATLVAKDVDLFLRNYMSNNILHVHHTKAASSSSIKIKFEILAPPVAPCRIASVRTRDHEDHHDDDARPEGESSAKRQRTSEHGTYLVGESSSEQGMDESNPSGSGEVNEAQLQKPVNDMLRVQCNSGEDHQYHLDQMHNYLKSDIVWESRKEDLLLQIPKKPALLYQSFERDPKAPPMTLLNQYLFYLKHGHEHKYIIKIVVRRAYGKFDVFSKSDYKYLHKNDIKDLYLMCINGKERDHDYQLGLESYQQKVNLTARTITFPGIERKKLLTFTSKPVVGLIYENNKKEKRVMIIKKIPKFCDVTLIRVLKLVEKMNKDVKHGYADPKLSDNDAEYLRFYEEYIKDRLRHRDQMRRWEMYVNGRPL
ncbi:hypothetical protein Tco_0789304 [Tanacetum coccineum]